MTRERTLESSIEVDLWTVTVTVFSECTSMLCRHAVDAVTISESSPFRRLLEPDLVNRNDPVLRLSIAKLACIGSMLGLAYSQLEKWLFDLLILVWGMTSLHLRCGVDQ